jgi:hypothetical protein
MLMCGFGFYVDLSQRSTCVTTGGGEMAADQHSVIGRRLRVEAVSSLT